MDMIVGLLGGAASEGGGGNQAEAQAKQAVQPNGNMWQQLAQMNQQQPNLARQASQQAGQTNAPQGINWQQLLGM